MDGSQNVVQVIEITKLVEEKRGLVVPRPLPPESLAWVDWQQAYLDLLAYKTRKGLTNLVIQPETPRQIVGLKNDKGIPICTLIADERVFAPQSFVDRALLQQAVTQLLCCYVDKFYQTHREQWDEQTMGYRPLDASDPNLDFGPQGVREEKAAGYVVRVPRSEQRLVEAVQSLLAEQKRLYEQENAGLPRIHFDRHLYQPLLGDMPEKAQIVPPGLKESATPYNELYRRYDDGTWDRARFAQKHILFPERGPNYDCMRILFG